jgi:pSer/pThr/pTyr-binding forkhead associated (FHA) protein
MSTSDSPLAPHAATPQELRERHEAERGAAPFLVFRDGDGRQVLRVLGDEPARLSVGRNPVNDVALPWDPGVSRLHSELERIGGEWTIADDGLSRNGTWVNEERVRGRLRLHDGDVIRVGRTALVFRLPQAPDSEPTVTGPVAVLRLSAAQRRVLVELCRPYQDTRMAAPPTNKEIAERLTVSVDAVKSQLRVLFSVFGLDALPQNQKRSHLAIRALEAGVVSGRDLADA